MLTTGSGLGVLGYEYDATGGSPYEYTQEFQTGMSDYAGLITGIKTNEFVVNGSNQIVYGKFVSDTTSGGFRNSTFIFSPVAVSPVKDTFVSATKITDSAILQVYQSGIAVVVNVIPPETPYEVANSFIYDTATGRIYVVFVDANENIELVRFDNQTLSVDGYRITIKQRK